MALAVIAKADDPIPWPCNRDVAQTGGGPLTVSENAAKLHVCGSISGRNGST